MCSVYSFKVAAKVFRSCLKCALTRENVCCPVLLWLIQQLVILPLFQLEITIIYCAWSIRDDLEPGNLTCGPPTQTLSYLGW